MPLGFREPGAAGEAEEEDLAVAAAEVDLAVRAAAEHGRDPMAVPADRAVVELDRAAVDAGPADRAAVELDRAAGDVGRVDRAAVDLDRADRVKLALGKRAAMIRIHSKKDNLPIR